MSKHHQSGKRWQEFVRKGRPGAGAPENDSTAGRGQDAGQDAGPAPGGRPQQPLRRAGQAPRAGPAAPRPASSKARPASSKDLPVPPAHVPAGPRAPQLDGTGQPYITLAQLLKKLSLVGSGGEAKARARSGGIIVNGAEEIRPGRKLHQGDRVTIDGHDHKVNLAAG